MGQIINIGYQWFLESLSKQMPYNFKLYKKTQSKLYLFLIRTFSKILMEFCFYEKQFNDL